MPLTLPYLNKIRRSRLHKRSTRVILITKVHIRGLKSLLKLQPKRWLSVMITNSPLQVLMKISLQSWTVTNPRCRHSSLSSSRHSSLRCSSLSRSKQQINPHQTPLSTYSLLQITPLLWARGWSRWAHRISSSVASKTKRGLSISKTLRTKSPRIINMAWIKDRLLRLKFLTHMGRRVIEVTRATLRDPMAEAITRKERRALSGLKTRSQTRIRVLSKLVASMNLQQLIRASHP